MGSHRADGGLVMEANELLSYTLTGAVLLILISWGSITGRLPNNPVTIICVFFIAYAAVSCGIDYLVLVEVVKPFMGGI